MRVYLHKACNSPAIDSDIAPVETCTPLAIAFPFPCFTCLEEIADESELVPINQLPM